MRFDTFNEMPKPINQEHRRAFTILTFFSLAIYQNSINFASLTCHYGNLVWHHSQLLLQSPAHV
jgi:hypothetical protein